MNYHEAFDDLRVKHLELIQAVISRLGSNGFLVKGWALTVAGIFFGFAVGSRNWQLGVASLLPTFFFWGLDAYFLRAERLFRKLYDRVRSSDSEIEPFFMSATSPIFTDTVTDVADIRRTMGTTVLATFYGGIIAATFALSLIVAVLPAPYGPDPGPTLGYPSLHTRHEPGPLHHP